MYIFFKTFSIWYYNEFEIFRMHENIVLWWGCCEIEMQGIW